MSTVTPEKLAEAAARIKAALPRWTPAFELEADVLLRNPVTQAFAERELREIWRQIDPQGTVPTVQRERIFANAKEKARANGANGHDSGTTNTTGSVPFLITAGMKQRLRDLGHTDDEIIEMTPAQAWALLPPTADGTNQPSSNQRGPEDNGAGPATIDDHAAIIPPERKGTLRIFDWKNEVNGGDERKPKADEAHAGTTETADAGTETTKPAIVVPFTQRQKQNANAGAPEPTLDEWDAGEDTGPIPPRGWLLATQFCRKFVSSLIGPGAIGKSALRLLQYLALATGIALTGQHVFRRSRVLLLSFEDDRDELRRRIRAARIHHKISHDDIKGWLFCATPKGLKFAEIRQGSRQAGQLEKVVRAAIERRKPDLLGLDPFIKTHGLEENDNAAMDFVCDLMAKIAIECDIAVDTPHHGKKGQQTAGDADAGRGASSARDAWRLVHTLTVMTEDEAKLFAISEIDRRAYVRLDPSKVNIAPSAMKATWFKLVGVKLENGTPEYPNGDEVQTVEPWSPPDVWANLSTVTLNDALTEIDAGLPNGQRFSSASAAKDRAAWRIVLKHCPDKSETQCRQIINTWVRTGLLNNQNYDDPIDRKEAKGLYVDNAKRPT